MKIFICTGSVADENSTVRFIVDEFTVQLQKYTEETIQTFYADLLKYKIQYSDGSITPFETGITQCPDDMVILEEEMLNSDIVLFCSPVYGNNVSGSIKVLLDRIMHWTHLFRLIGKYGIAFSVSSRTGEKDTVEYLYDVMEGLGLSMLSKECFCTGRQTREIMRNIIDVQAMLIAEKIKSNIFSFSKKQEREFQIYQKLFKDGRGLKHELMYWKTNRMLECSSLEEYMNLCKEL